MRIVAIVVVGVVCAIVPARAQNAKSKELLALSPSARNAFFDKLVGPASRCSRVVRTRFHGRSLTGGLYGVSDQWSIGCQNKDSLAVFILDEPQGGTMGLMSTCDSVKGQARKLKIAGMPDDVKPCWAKKTRSAVVPGQPLKK